MTVNVALPNLHAPNDPPVFILLASPSWGPSAWLPDTAYQKIPIGGTGQVLTVQADGSINWQNSASGFANPMTTSGDIMYENAVPAPARLPIGTNGQFLQVVSGLPSWQSFVGLTNPMTTPGDLIDGGTAGVPQRIPIGSAGQVLTVSGGVPSWQNATTGFGNPMTTIGDLITGGTGGTPGRLAAGSNGNVLAIVGGVPLWVASSTVGFVNPMTTTQDLIVGGAAGAAGRLAVGANGQVLGVSSGIVGWVNNPAGFANPMIAPQDLIVGGVSGAAGRLPVGSSGQVLTVSGGAVSWAPPVSGFSNPMTTTGDLITGASGGAAQRLGIGAANQVLTVIGGVPTWQNSASGFSNPMTTPQDLIVGGAAGAAGRLGVGTAGQSLTVVNGAVAWARNLGIPVGGPSGSQQTLWLQPDGRIVVLPLSTYSIVGDDSVWFNTAFTLLPTITGGSGQYGGAYNGPWIIGTVQGIAADYNINTGILMPVNSGVTINLLGMGPGSRLLVGGSSTVGITSHCAMGGPQAGHPAQQNAGTIAGWRIDGQAGGLVGVELGGSWGRHLDVAITNFQQANSIGLHLNNATNPAGTAEWTEKSRFFVDLLQNTTAVVIEQTGNTSGHDSMEYNDFWFYIIQTNSATNNGPGVLLRGGAFLSGGSLHIRGNFPTNSGPVLSLTGQDATSGNYSSIYHQLVDITVESNASSTIPQTVNFGSANNVLHQCVGIMSFQFANFVASNAVAGNFGFNGIVDGDNTLINVNASVTTPAIPASGNTRSNTTNTMCTVYVSPNGATGVNVNVNGISTGLSSGAFELDDDGTIGLGTYSGGPPTWQWVGHL